MQGQSNPETPLVSEQVALHPAERSKFKALILTNPNYFGTLPGLGFEPVKKMSYNTTYEELICVGLNPDADQLEAVVNLKQHGGYNGDYCTPGSTEYVRFFVDHGGTWVDLGRVTFAAHDTSGSSALPLSYNVGIALDEVRKYCTVENIVNIRAILSWDWEPTPGDPNFSPIWGNVVNVRVQIAPKIWFTVPIGELLQDKVISIDQALLSQIDLSQELQPAIKGTQTFEDLKALYANKKVPEHRFGFSEAHKLLQGPIAASLVPPGGKGEKSSLKTPAPAPGGALSIYPSAALTLGPELSSIIAALEETQGDTTYEQLECAGYNPYTGMVGGVITLKQSLGYSGDLCSPGSAEYVSFWVFYSGAWQFLGTTQVQVHDLASINPAHPVEYAVFRGVNVPEYLCNEIIGLPLRAILSWATPHLNPNTPPVWGNIVDTHIQPNVGDGGTGEERVRLMRINQMPTSGISEVPQNIGLGPMIGLAHTTGDAQECSIANDSPFGGPVYIEGDFTIASDAYFDPATGYVLPGQKPMRYTVQVEGISPVSPPVLLTNSFGITVYPTNPPSGTISTSITQQFVNQDGLAAYIYYGGVVQAVNPRTVAVWDAGGLPEGQYRITFTGYTWNGVSYVPLATGSKVQDLYIFNGYPHSELLIGGGTATFYRPEVHLQITSVIPAGGGSPHPAQDCGDVLVGDTVVGMYSVTDRFFRLFSLGVEPVTIGGVPQPLGSLTISGPSTYPPASTTGTSGTWQLDTTGMTPCGYTLVLGAWDRALVGDSCLGHYNQIGVGFCLRGPGT